MKKIFSLLLITILLLIPTFVVKADMDGPATIKFDMVVVDPNGIDYYDYEDNKAGHLNKNDKFTVNYEYNDTFNISVGDNTYTIKKSSGVASLATEEVDPKTYKSDLIEKYNSEKEVLVYKDVDIRKGPASVYKKVGSIKKNTKIKFQYRIGGSEEYNNINGASYIYVEYNGVKGWVETLDSKILFPEEGKYIVPRDLKIACAVIPKNTILKTKYKSDQWSGNALFTYNGCTDLIHIFKDDNIFEVGNSLATAKKDIEVYQYFDNSGNKIMTIPNGAKFTEISYYTDNPYDEAIRHLYVSYNGKEGWIKVNDADYEYVDNKENETTTTTTTTKVKDEEKDDEINAKDYTLIWVIVGGAVALAALVTIIIINKKKKAKKAKQKIEDEKIDISQEEVVDSEETTQEEKENNNNE